jgi:hypothetical protein
MIDIPIELPEGWKASRYDDDCVLIEAQHGFVTINVVERSYLEGIGRPRKTSIGVDVYRGRGWRQQLFNAAVEHLWKYSELSHG